MDDYHFVYKDVEGATTQWNDIQRRLRNLPEKSPDFVLRADADEQPKSKEWLDEREADELEDDHFLEQYRLFSLPFSYTKKTKFIDMLLGVPAPGAFARGHASQEVTHDCC